MKFTYLKKIIILPLIFNFVGHCYGVDNNEMLTKIRINIQNLKDSPVGAIDANGCYTKASNKGLNCSGFVKWIADGFYVPIRKRKNKFPLYMSLQELRLKHPECRGDRYTNLFENSRDPYFGLDWTRNIAVTLANERNDREYSNEDFDVRYSQVLDYVEDRGYPLNRIAEVLLEQARLHPNRFYLCSISGPFGESPRLHQHYHVCAFIPYIDEEGNKRVAVFERNKETSFGYLEKRYPNTYCHLVWLNMDGDFELKVP